METEYCTHSGGREGNPGSGGAGSDHSPDPRPERASACSAIYRMGDEAELQEELAAGHPISHLSALTVSFSR